MTKAKCRTKEHITTIVIQGGRVLNVNNSPFHSPVKSKLTCIMWFSWKMLPKKNSVLQISI